MNKTKSESIPNSAMLYRRVLGSHIKVNDGIRAGAFSRGANAVEGLSAEWEKYVSDAEETRFRMASKDCPKETRKNKSELKKFGVYSLITKEVRNLKLEVIHTPSWNIAHTSIRGLHNLDKSDKLQIRQELANMAQLVLRPLAA